MNDIQRAKALLLEETCETCSYQSCMYGDGSWYYATREWLQSCYLKMTSASFEWEEDDSTENQER